MIASLIFCLGLGIGIFFAENEEVEEQSKKSEKFNKFDSSLINEKTQYSKTFQKVIAKAEQNYNKKALSHFEKIHFSIRILKYDLLLK